MKCFFYVLLCAVLVALCAAPAFAQPIDSFFDVYMEGDAYNWNQLVAGGGSGWNGDDLGPWYSYPQTTAIQDDRGYIEYPPTYWNQWYYGGNYDPTRYKVVDLSFDYKRISPEDQGFFFIVINWSTPQWVDPDPLIPSPPLVDQEEGVVYIERSYPVLNQPIFNDVLMHYSMQDFIIPSGYNPEWVSIDVRGYNFEITDGVFVQPEPGSLLALGSGLTALLGMALRKRH